MWKDIEKCKNDPDLRRVLTRHWAKYQVPGGGALLYNIYWKDEFIVAIRTVNFCSGNSAAFHTSMAGLSILNLMPWDKSNKTAYKRDQVAKKKTETTRTYAEEKKMYKHARFPPTRYERLCILLTSYGLLLEMLFTANNSHQRGVMDVRDQLQSMAQTSLRLSPLYLTNVCWGAMVDANKYFNECMAPEDFEGGPRCRLRWPTSELALTVNSIRGPGTLDWYTLPDQYRSHATSVAWEGGPRETAGQRSTMKATADDARGANAAAASETADTATTATTSTAAAEAAAAEAGGAPAGAVAAAARAAGARASTDARAAQGTATRQGTG